MKDRAVERDSLLYLGWWNTSLCPPGREVQHQDDGELALAKEVAKDLLETNSLDLLALGEVSSSNVDWLKRGCVPTLPLATVVDAQESERGRRRIGAIYNTQRLHLLDHRFITAVYEGRTGAAGLLLQFSILTTQTILFVFIVHWPSRRIPDASNKRFMLGCQLQQRVEHVISQEQSAHVVLMGDFNDEPFDRSMSHALLGSRDRRLVRRSSGRLYNPFWRRLGEQHSLDEDAADLYGGGTHYYRSTPATHWHTYDQLLVSASLLGQSDWTLLESSLLVWQCPPLLKENGHIRSPFDHFPIVGALIQTSSLRRRTAS